MMIEYAPLTIFHGSRTGDDLADCMKERDELMRWWHWHVTNNFDTLRRAYDELNEAKLQQRWALDQITQLHQRMARIERHVRDYNAAQKRARTPRPIRR